MRSSRVLPAFLIVCIVLVPPLVRCQAPPVTHAERSLDLFSQPVAPPALPPSLELAGKKSVGLAVVYSLLVPGLGEAYVGNFSSGKYFLGAEALLWLTYGAFDIYGSSLRSDARTYAAVHAGVNATGKSDQFFVDIGNFMTVDDFNQKRLQERELERVYDPAAGFAWKWDSEANRAAFRDQRLHGENVLNNRKFVVAAVIVNHVASAINAARAAISHNREAEGALGDLQIGASLMGDAANPTGVRITFIRPL